MVRNGNRLRLAEEAPLLIEQLALAPGKSKDGAIPDDLRILNRNALFGRKQWNMQVTMQIA
jgi:hypothetical protein